MDTQDITPKRGGASEQARVESMVQDCLPSIRRWAHGRLPSAARGSLDTCDLVQEVALRMLGKRDVFEVRHPYAVQSYMQRAYVNLIRDEVRRVARRPIAVQLPEEEQVPSTDASPLDHVMDEEVAAQYRASLAKLRAKDRDLVVAWIEGGRFAQEIERQFAYETTNAARVAVSRALGRLAREMGVPLRLARLRRTPPRPVAAE